MSANQVRLDAGGLLPVKTKVDQEATERLVARTYRHAALGDRPVVRLTSDRLGEAEDLAMEFLGFAAPEVTKPIAVQQRRSLGFAAWALTNDPGNARYALDLVKRMKAAARKARSKPGHAWDAYADMAKELGRSVRHFLPVYWEEVGRTFKDLGNHTYAGRALNKSLEAERVHALESDRARRRDVVLEFVLAGCLAGRALSEYAKDLTTHYEPEEAFAIFRDLCVRRTRGGMAPWAALAKDFVALAKAAGHDAGDEFEKWLSEVIDAPAMGRAANQFWKSCGKYCKNIVSRDPAFAISLLRHAQSKETYYGESKLLAWLALLEGWGVFPYLWKDCHNGAPPLGEPIATWFGRVVRDEVPAPALVLSMLEKLAPRLKKEKTPLALTTKRAYRTEIDIDVIEACLTLGMTVDDPPAEFSVKFDAWLAADVDHPLRNQDLIHGPKDERFRTAILRAMDDALACRGVSIEKGWRRPKCEQRAFPLAAADRPGIKALWYEHTSGVIAAIEKSGLASFEEARELLHSTLWPDALRLFPDLRERLSTIDSADILKRTLRAGLVAEYGWPALESTVDENDLEITWDDYEKGATIFLSFPNVVVTDRRRAWVVGSDGRVATHELRVPKKCKLAKIDVVGEDIAVSYRTDSWESEFYWSSNPSRTLSRDYIYSERRSSIATGLDDGSVFFGRHASRPEDKQPPAFDYYFHDGRRFWRVKDQYDPELSDYVASVTEVDPETGKSLRDSVPPWFEETDGGKVQFGVSELMVTPSGAAESPLGAKDGLLGWKTIRRGDDYHGESIDGRRWSERLVDHTGRIHAPIGLLRQPGTDAFLPISSHGTVRGGAYWLWDPSGSTRILALIEASDVGDDQGQAALLPLCFWHCLKARDLASSRKLRVVTKNRCDELLHAAEQDRLSVAAARGPHAEDDEEPPTHLVNAVQALLPTAPPRMVEGVASVVESLEQESAKFYDLRESCISESKGEASGGLRAARRKIDAAARNWGLDTFQCDEETSLVEHLLAVAAFLKGDSDGGDLPAVDDNWFPMLDRLPLQCWSAFWETAAKGLEKDSEVPWLDFLEFWQELGLADLPGQFAILTAAPKGAKKIHYRGYDVDVDAGTSFALRKGEDRFIGIEVESYNEPPYTFLRYSTGKKPGPPPGYVVAETSVLRSSEDSKGIDDFIEAVKKCEDLPLPSSAELEEVAQRLAASAQEIGLLWMCALNINSYDHNFLPGALRKRLGWKVADAAAARVSLNNMEDSVRSTLLASVISEGIAPLFSGDFGSAFRSLEVAWREIMPTRLPVEASMQKRLASFSQTYSWQRVEHEEILSIAAEPLNHPALQPREIKIHAGEDGPEFVGPRKNEPALESSTLRTLVHLVGLVHAETSAGHPLRAAMPELIRQLQKFLSAPKILLPLRSFHIYDFEKRSVSTPSEWITKHLGKPKTQSKDGTARFDNGLVAAAAMDSTHRVAIGFRPAKVRDSSDLTRLYALADLDNEYPGERAFVSLVVLIKSAGFQRLAKSILAKRYEDGEWLQNPLVTSPEVVRDIEKQHKLEEDAALLYAQLLALPDCTSKNVRLWNDWGAARLKKATAMLVSKKLVMEAKRARAGRTAFLPGEWSDLKAPWLPLETWKLTHLAQFDLDGVTHDAVGGPMVLRPMDDVFAAAWQRVLDGDAPRYLDAKKTKKGTKK